MGSQLEPAGWDPLSGALNDDSSGDEEERFNPFKQNSGDGGGEETAGNGGLLNSEIEKTAQQQQRELERQQQAEEIQHQKAALVQEQRLNREKQEQLQQQRAGRQQSTLVARTSAQAPSPPAPGSPSSSPGLHSRTLVSGDGGTGSSTKGVPAFSSDSEQTDNTNAASTSVIALVASEQVLVNINRVAFLSNGQDEVHGTLRVTNYRLHFEPRADEVAIASGNLSGNSGTNGSSAGATSKSPSGWLFQDIAGLFDVPLNCIDKISRVSNQLGSSRGSKQSLLLHLTCKDVRKMSFRFADPVDAGKVHDLVRMSAFPVSEGSGIKWLFALEYGKARLKEMGMTKATPGWNTYDPVSEWVRQGVFESRDTVGRASNDWRLSSVNSNYKFAPSYPSLLLVPRKTSDHDLVEVGGFRSKCRIPAMTYYHSKTKGSIWRCSQPKVGVGGNTCRQDEQMWSNVLACSATSFARIVDCRPFKNALANKARGMGYEDEMRYERTNISFQNIQNIHVSRKSLEALITLVCGSGTSASGSAVSSGTPGYGWLGAVEGTGWLNHVRSVLNASITVARFVGINGFPVMVHCSDGWDRTSQVCALAQVLLDPHFRTIQGLQVIIEKDWLSFGYKFMQRTGHGSDADSEERSPCFLLFLDCLWQLVRLFPTMFEFNEELLLCIAEHLYSCKFGTFLCDNERERVRMGLQEKCISLWDHVNENRDQFESIFFDASNVVSEPLLPHPSAVGRQVTLWDRYYLRYASQPSLNKHAFNYLGNRTARLHLDDPVDLANKKLADTVQALAQAQEKAQQLQQQVLSLRGSLTDITMGK